MVPEDKKDVELNEISNFTKDEISKISDAAANDLE